MVRPEELETLLVVARKHGVKRLCVTQGGLEVELEAQPVPLVPVFATPAPAEPPDESDPLFDAVES
jgi:hypothetical protein